MNSTAPVRDLIDDLTSKWRTAVERIADQNYAGWRELVQATGYRLPEEMRRELQPMSVWDAQRPAFVKSLLEWAHAPTGSMQMVDELLRGLDGTGVYNLYKS